MPSINAWGSDDPVEVAKGGTGATSLGDGHVLLGSGTGAITSLDVTAKGSLLVGDGTTDPVALAVGANNLVLTADSAEVSGLKWAAGGGGGSGAVFLSSATASASATLDFASSIDSTYNVYMFVIQDLIPSVDGATYRVRTSSDGGSSYDASASNYAYQYNNAGSAVTSGAQTYIQISEAVGNTTGEKLDAILYLNNPSGTDYTQCLWHAGVLNNSASPRMSIGMGIRKQQAIVDAIRFYPSSGTITSGTIKMYGLTQPS